MLGASGHLAGCSPWLGRGHLGEVGAWPPPVKCCDGLWSPMCWASEGPWLEGVTIASVCRGACLFMGGPPKLCCVKFTGVPPSWK